MEYEGDPVRDFVIKVQAPVGWEATVLRREPNGKCLLILSPVGPQDDSGPGRSREPSLMQFSPGDSRAPASDPSQRFSSGSEHVDKYATPPSRNSTESVDTFCAPPDSPMKTG